MYFKDALLHQWANTLFLIPMSNPEATNEIMCHGWDLAQLKF